MKTEILAVLAVVGFLGTSSPGARADSLTIVTSTNALWRTIGPAGNLEGTPIDSVGLEWESQHTGWNTSVDYDDTEGAGWHPPIEDTSGAHGEGWPTVWTDGPLALGSTPAYFRTVFVLDGTPTKALLDCLTDDDAQVWINGELVVNDRDNVASTVVDLDVRRFLRSGPNLIAVKAHDSWPYAQPGTNYEAFALRLDVEFSPAALSIRCSQVELCWLSAANVDYQIQYQSTLTGGQWTNLGAPIAGDGARKCVTDTIPEGEPQRFYRTVTAP